MIPVYVSNGAFVTFRNGRDFRLIPQVLPRLHADGLEFLMYESWQDELKELRATLKNARLNIPVMHLDKQIGDMLACLGLKKRDEALKVLARDLDTAELLGAGKLVMHLWNGPCSDDRFDEALELFGEMWELCDRRGLSLTVENVTCIKNVCLDHLNALCARYPFARFTYDTKMAYLHGENELLETEKYYPLLEKGFITHLHVNDTLLDPSRDRLPIMHIGEGRVDFDRFFALVRKSGFAGTATVESTSVGEDGVINEDRLNLSLDMVRKGLNG